MTPRPSNAARWSPRRASANARYTVCKPVYETCYQHVHLHGLQAGVGNADEERLLHGLQAGLRDRTKNICYTVCKPVYETQTKQICYTVCKPVYETCDPRDLLHGLQAGLRDQHQEHLLHRLQAGLGDEDEEHLLHGLQAGLRDAHQEHLLHRLQAGLQTHTKTYCVNVCKPVYETCYRTCSYTVCKPVHYTKVVKSAAATGNARKSASPARSCRSASKSPAAGRGILLLPLRVVPRQVPHGVRAVPAAEDLQEGLGLGNEAADDRLRPLCAGMLSRSRFRTRSAAW